MKFTRFCNDPEIACVKAEKALEAAEADKTRLEKEKAWLIDVFVDMACPPPAYRLKECSGLGRDFGICAQCLSEASEKAVSQ